MDGLDLARAVRSDPSIAGTPIILYTATYELWELERMARAAGVSTVLQKPADPKEILLAVESLPRGARPAEMTCKVLLADEDPEFREELTAAIERAPSLELVGVAENALDAVELSRLHQPDVAVVDVRMRDGGGPHVAQELQAVAPRSNGARPVGARGRGGRLCRCSTREPPATCTRAVSAAELVGRDRADRRAPVGYFAGRDRSARGARRGADHRDRGRRRQDGPRRARIDNRPRSRLCARRQGPRRHGRR